MYSSTKWRVSLVLTIAVLVFFALVANASEGKKASPVKTGQTSNTCVACHTKVTPGVVADWKSSEHFKRGTDCATCHGTAHNTAADAEKATHAGPDVCKKCHGTQVTQFMSGKHAIAFVAGGIPNFHNVPREFTEGGKGCGGCHKFGAKTPEQLAEVKKNGLAAQASTCDACHTRHTFSKVEASQPQACLTCHQGPDHDQLGAYSTSKHAMRVSMKQMGALPKTAAAPTCATCHMSEGNHAVKTAWGFFGVRVPLSDDPKWQADQVTILQALGALDMSGKPTPLFDGLKGLGAFRATKEEWQAERDKMIKVCSQCHTASYAKAELEKDDKLLREADALMAEGIRVVADLYKDGVVEKPAAYAAPFPALLTWRDAPNPAEDKLFEMYSDHRPNVYLGAFHNNPAFAFDSGYANLKNDLYQIKQIAAQLRAEKGRQAKK